MNIKKRIEDWKRFKPSRRAETFTFSHECDLAVLLDIDDENMECISEAIELLEFYAKCEVTHRTYGEGGALPSMLSDDGFKAQSFLKKWSYS